MLYPTKAKLGYIFFQSAFFGSAHAFVLTLLFSSFTFLSFTLPVPQGTRKAMTHLHGSSLFLLSVVCRTVRRVLQAALASPPCFCRWQRSSLLHRGFHCSAALSKRGLPPNPARNEYDNLKSISFL